MRQACSHRNDVLLRCGRTGAVRMHAPVNAAAERTGPMSAWLLLLNALSLVLCHVLASRRGANPVFWGVMGALFGPLTIPLVFLGRRGPRSQRATDRQNTR